MKNDTINTKTTTPPTIRPDNIKTSPLSAPDSAAEGGVRRRKFSEYPFEPRCPDTRPCNIQIPWLVTRWSRTRSRTQMIHHFSSLRNVMNQLEGELFCALKQSMTCSYPLCKTGRIDTEEFDASRRFVNHRCCYLVCAPRPTHSGLRCRRCRQRSVRSAHFNPSWHVAHVVSNRASWGTHVAHRGVTSDPVFEFVSVLVF